ncbi:unnamed protein product [Somion occarium]|uniref:Uncharacterized protein n=1 Tax=Somion occarium TaxID=3059160 RepID=A0ABP1D6R7_9APHY
MADCVGVARKGIFPEVPFGMSQGVVCIACVVESLDDYQSESWSSSTNMGGPEFKLGISILEIGKILSRSVRMTLYQ